MADVSRAKTDGRAVLALDVGTSSCRASLYDLMARPVEGYAASRRSAPAAE